MIAYNNNVASKYGIFNQKVQKEKMKENEKIRFNKTNRKVYESMRRLKNVKEIRNRIIERVKNHVTAI